MAFPTETVYGLGAAALDPLAVARVFQAKGRPTFDPLIVHVVSVEDAWNLVTQVPAAAERLAEAFWPGPLTLVLPKRSFVPDLVTSGQPSVGVRIPSHPIARALIQAAESPVAAPSANRFGGISPTRAEHVAQELGAGVEMILDGGPCQTGVESTVVSLLGPEPEVLRLGGVTVEAIGQVLGRPVAVVDALVQAERQAVGQAAPGMLARHYAPGTPMLLVDALSGWNPVPCSGERLGVLAMDARSADYAACRCSLDEGGDLVRAAARLFAALRELDAAGLDRIVAERVPNVGLGRAINDRLRRAAWPGG